jgi:hypothetical protein
VNRPEIQIEAWGFMDKEQLLMVELEEARRKFNTASADIGRIRDEIAVLKCPLKIGEIVPLTKDGKDLEGIVESIRAKPDWAEAHEGAPVEWIASGKRINKTTGEPGEWGFDISSDGSTMERGRWRVKTLNEILGIE